MKLSSYNIIKYFKNTMLWITIQLISITSISINFQLYEEIFTRVIKHFLNDYQRTILWGN